MCLRHGAENRKTPRIGQGHRPPDDDRGKRTSPSPLRYVQAALLNLPRSNPIIVRIAVGSLFKRTDRSQQRSACRTRTPRATGPRLTWILQAVQVTAANVTERVSRDVGDRTANRFGWDFRPFLLRTPELRSYDGKSYWTVLIERSDETEGYHVVFDQQAEQFGLASGGVCIGLYGDFLNALDSM